MSPVDEKLLGRALGGDEEAIGELLAHHGPNIRRGLSVGPKWQSVVDEDDIMQVTYLEVFLRIRQFRPDGENGFARWLHRIAHNNLCDAVRDLERKKRPQNRVGEPRGEDSGPGLLDRLGGTGTTPSRAAGRREIQEAITEAIKLLPLPYADAIRLCDLEGKSAVEAAAELERSPGAVRMLLARARDRLREVMGSGSAFFSDGA